MTWTDEQVPLQNVSDVELKNYALCSITGRQVSRQIKAKGGPATKHETFHKAVTDDNGWNLKICYHWLSCFLLVFKREFVFEQLSHPDVSV